MKIVIAALVLATAYAEYSSVTSASFHQMTRAHQAGYALGVALPLILITLIQMWRARRKEAAAATTATRSYGRRYGSW